MQGALQAQALDGSRRCLTSEGRGDERPHGWWIAYYHRGREIRESAKTTSERKAGTFLRERLRTAGRPDFVAPAAERVTFDDLATMYLTDYRVNGQRSLRDAERHAETLRATFGFDKALDITADRIARYTAARLDAGKRPATVNRELAALRRMFSLAVRAGNLAGRPPITLLAEDNAREGFIDPPEFTRLLEKLPELDEPAVADGGVRLSHVPATWQYPRRGVDVV